MEKIQFVDQQENEFYIETCHEFKKHCGYSGLEIDRIRNAIENVLVHYSGKSLRDRLHVAGLCCVFSWFQCANFVLIVGVT